ncbi:MAG: L,D-transpeptidase family protein [Sedimentisphaerales bacterium]|nr:L,D-transpeptidase family protein [Sedimentisphaerales bacterium]
MARYSPKSYLRLKGKRRKWLYVVFVVLLIVAVKMKIHIRGFSPAAIFGEDDSEFIPTPDNIATEDEVIAPHLKLIPESNLRQISQSPYKPLTEPAEQHAADPPVQENVPTLDLPQGHRPTPWQSPELDATDAKAVSSLKAKPSNIVQARDKLNEMLSNKPMSTQQLAFVKEALSDLADQWLFSRKVYPQDEICSNYKVEPGDHLVAIGKKHNVPYQIIMRINNITDPKTLRAGETIKVINGPFRAVISRSTFTMDLYVQSTFVRSFKVGLGRPEHETPTGRWCVETGGKLIAPPWRDPDTGRIYQAKDPDYPLGSRWIALQGLEGDAKGRRGFAIHGTKKTDELGTRSSRGCIRMKDEEVVMVYDLLMPEFSEVVVVE